MLESFILRWGYLAVGVGTFFEGEAVVVTAAAFAHRGLLLLPWVIVTAFAGSVVGDQMWFHLGRRFGRSIIERRRSWVAGAARAKASLDRYGWVFVVGFRFVYGIRVATPIFLGATGYSPKRFLLLNVAGGALWALAFGIAGWTLGASLQLLLKRTVRVEEVLAVGLACALAAWVAVRLARRSCPKPGGR